MSSKVHSWDDFKARKAAGEPASAPAEPAPLEEQLKQSIVEAQARSRKPKRAATPAAESLADVLQRAVRLAVGRARLPKREIVVREQTLLDVLVEAMRGGAA